MDLSALLVWTFPRFWCGPIRAPRGLAVARTRRRADSPSRGLAVVALLLSSACSRRAPGAMPDATAPVDLAVRVPAALSVARAIDSLSVAIDPESLGLTHLAADPGMGFGIETTISVFPQGQSGPVSERHSVSPGIAFDADLSATWSTERDGIPAPGTKYVVEMQLVLFETDAPPIRPASRAGGAPRARAQAHAPTRALSDPLSDAFSDKWDPHAGRYKLLWERALRQAEE